MEKIISSFKRAIKSGIISFTRNIGLNIATILVMVLVTIIITSLFLLNPISEVLVQNIKEKISISVYFEEGVQEEEILEIKEKISESINTKEINYISSEKALEKFVEKYKDNFTIMSSLSEIGTNPFLSSLDIKAEEIDDYEKISYFLENAPFRYLINKIDYGERKPVIDGIFSIVSATKRGGFVISIIFGLIAIIFAFTAIKSAIYNSKEEISIMKLVGASNWFIKMPFLIQGALVGLISSFFAFLLMLIFFYFFNNQIESFMGEVSVLRIYLSNSIKIILIQFGVGITLGVISSYIAVKMHLSKF